MQTTKPQLQRVYVQIVDSQTRKSKTRTVYNATIDDVIRKLDQPVKPRRRDKATA